jgi:serine/threonine protein phosphatase 1
MDQLTCVVGDVHGQIDKLKAVLGGCERFCAGHHQQLVFLGDYVDRGRDSRAVVDLLMVLSRQRPEDVVCLRGNHEACVLAAAADRLEMLPGKPTMEDWLGAAGGGRATMASYGVAHAKELPPEHLAWMEALPLSYDDGSRLFVHAGVRPGVPLDEQADDDLMWIREPFLSNTEPFARLIVHGHTPTSDGKPDLHANRLNVDTGAGYNGPLTAAIFDKFQQRPLAYVSDSGSSVEVRLASDH